MSRAFTFFFSHFYDSGPSVQRRLTGLHKVKMPGCVWTEEEKKKVLMKISANYCKLQLSEFSKYHFWFFCTETVVDF